MEDLNKYKEIHQKAEEIAKHLREKQSHSENEMLLYERNVYKIESELLYEELLNAEESLELTKEKYIELFNYAPIGYITFDENYVIQEANLTMTEIIGEKPEDLIQRRFSTFMDSESQNLFYSYVENLKKTKLKQTCELKIKRKNNEIRYIKMDSSIFYFKLHNSLLILSCIIDTTESKKNKKIIEESENKFKELSSTKDKFFSIIAHDLKNPFYQLMGLSELLVNNFSSYDISKIENYIKMIHETSKRGYNLLENLLQWAKTQSENFKPNPKDILLKPLAIDSINLVIGNSVSKNINLSYDIPVDCYVFADQNMLEIILHNLISNAVKFTGRGGSVSVSAKKEKNYVEICVEDTGIGIRETDLGKLFRIDVSHTTPGTDKEKGTGLGLILCKEFVEKNGGTITVKSIYGQGSSFNFTLPVSMCQTV